LTRTSAVAISPGRCCNKSGHGWPRHTKECGKALHALRSGPVEDGL
jgi:hypothetical protein